MPTLPSTPTLASFTDLYGRAGWTPLDVAEAVLARLATQTPAAAFICQVTPDALRERARQLGAVLARDPGIVARQPLFGVPFAVKDNIDVAGLPTTCACPEFAYLPARSARVVEQLEAAGALLIGKTNLDQFATGLVGTRSPYGAPANPFGPEHISGGSSSGSAVVVALGLAAFALGTDTAGSGRVPAAFCNLVGVKPTPGLVSTRGVFPACRSLDCVSVFGHTVSDGWTVLQALAGVDAEDAYSRPIAALGPLTRTVRIGVPSPLSFCGDARAEGAFAAALASLREDPALQWTTVPFQPFADVAALLYKGPWVAERRLAIGDFFTQHGELMDSSVRAVLGTADGRTAVDTFAALHQLEAGRRMTERVFEAIDLMVLPSAPTLPTRAEVNADPLGKNSELGTYTNFVNLLGLCALALPGPFRSDGLPAGITLIASAGGDHRLAEFARRIESRLHRRLGVGGAEPPRATGPLAPLAHQEPMVAVAVVGAHLSGMPLNWQLSERGGRLLRVTRTAPRYRLFALASTTPPKPGLLAVGVGGCRIEVELWELPARHYGGLVANIPPPLGIGTLSLEDGTQVQGFLCEAVATGPSEDISQFGGWRAYLEREAGRR